MPAYVRAQTDSAADLPRSTVLITIQDKVNNPSPDDPFEPDIAVLLKNDKAKFLTTAKEWTKKCVIHASAVLSCPRKFADAPLEIRDMN